MLIWLTTVRIGVEKRSCSVRIPASGEFGFLLKKTGPYPELGAWPELCCEIVLRLWPGTPVSKTQTG